MGVRACVCVCLLPPHPELDELLAKLIACVAKSLHALKNARGALEGQYNRRRHFVNRNIDNLVRALKHIHDKQAHAHAHLQQVRATLRALAAALQKLKHHRHEVAEECKDAQHTLRKTTQHEQEKQHLFGEQLEMLRVLSTLLVAEHRPEHPHHHNRKAAPPTTTAHP